MHLLVPNSQFTGDTSFLIFRNVMDAYYGNFTSAEYANGNGTYFESESSLGYPIDCYYLGKYVILTICALLIS
jgi:hypothetical protein